MIYPSKSAPLSDLPDGVRWRDPGERDMSLLSFDNYSCNILIAYYSCFIFASIPEIVSSVLSCLSDKLSISFTLPYRALIYPSIFLTFASNLNIASVNSEEEEDEED